MKGIIIDLKDITDSREVMESKESPKIRWFIYILLIVIAAAIVFSCFFEIDEYTKVTGEIKTLDASSSVISSSNCKLKEICVSEGQTVKKGDLLFILDADYAREQKEILESKLNGYQSDLANTELLKKCVEKNENLFKNDELDSKYYYRYEQYKNEVLLSVQEIDKSQLNNNLTNEEKQNNLDATKNSITDKKNQLAEYQSLLKCVENDCEYIGNSNVVRASYEEYNTNLRKSALLRDQYQSTYETIDAKYNEQSEQEKITSPQVETAKQESDSAYSALISFQSSYLSDIRSQIILIENQLISDSDNIEFQTALNDYNELKMAVEQGYEYNTNDTDLQISYDQYISGYTALNEEYSNKLTEYRSLYDRYIQQSGETVITDTNVYKAKSAYESAQLDVENLKNTFVSQLQSKIEILTNEIKTLENNQKSLELSLKGIDDLDKYEKLTSNKIKNEAVVALNSEIDSLNENIASVESQLIEISETIKNSEIKASFDGTVTLVNELNPGDIIQSGNQLCSVIPTGAELKVMLYIPENEISKIEIGQDTEYIFDAIPYNEYGKITGKITSISADSIVNESAGTKFYIAQADLSVLSLKNNDGNTREVKNGMMVEAKTICGSKKAIVWLLEKINFLD